MKEEVSAGIILFNDNEDRKFLLLNYPSKHWDFVKGKMEKDEHLMRPHLEKPKKKREFQMLNFLKDLKKRLNITSMQTTKKFIKK